VARRLRSRGLVARTVGIKIRFADFRTVTRVRTLPEWVDSAAALHETAIGLYAGLDLDRPRIRLVGVKAEGLQEADRAVRQLSFDDLIGRSGARLADLERAADDVVARFGSAAVRPARQIGGSGVGSGVGSGGENGGGNSPGG
jgi:DNA polymerase-4